MPCLMAGNVNGLWGNAGEVEVGRELAQGYNNSLLPRK